MNTVNTEEKSIRRRLYRVLRKTGIKKEIIDPNSSYSEDLNFDKTDWTIFIFYLESIFNISIREEELTKFGKIGDTLHFLTAQSN